MVPVTAPRFDIDECNSEAERAFIEALHARAASGWSADGWSREDRFLLSVCRSDPDHTCVLRTLRVDYDGETVSFGPDETLQFATDLDPAGRSSGPCMTCVELAAVAVDWLEREMRRPIVRCERNRPGFWRREWDLVDTGEPISSDSANAGRCPGLGKPNRVVHVSGSVGT